MTSLTLVPQTRSKLALAEVRAPLASTKSLLLRGPQTRLRGVEPSARPPLCSLLATALWLHGERKSNYYSRLQCRVRSLLLKHGQLDPHKERADFEETSEAVRAADVEESPRFKTHPIASSDGSSMELLTDASSPCMSHRAGQKPYCSLRHRAGTGLLH